MQVFNIRTIRSSLVDENYSRNSVSERRRPRKYLTLLEQQLFKAMRISCRWRGVDDTVFTTAAKTSDEDGTILAHRCSCTALG